MCEEKPASSTIEFSDFAKLDLRTAKILEATEHPNADRLFVLKVETGDETRQIIAGIRGYYQADELVGKTIVIVANLAPRKMRGMESQGMLLAASSEDRSEVILLTTDRDTSSGLSCS